MKVLVGIIPSGLVIFISELSGGHVPDINLTIQSGSLDLLHHGPSVMAEKGFDTEECLAEIGVSLNIPQNWFQANK